MRGVTQVLVWHSAQNQFLRDHYIEMVVTDWDAYWELM